MLKSSVCYTVSGLHEDTVRQGHRRRDTGADRKGCIHTQIETSVSKKKWFYQLLDKEDFPLISSALREQRTGSG